MITSGHISNLVNAPHTITDVQPDLNVGAKHHQIFENEHQSLSLNVHNTLTSSWMNHIPYTFLRLYNFFQVYSRMSHPNPPFTLKNLQSSHQNHLTPLQRQWAQCLFKIVTSICQEGGRINNPCMYLKNKAPTTPIPMPNSKRKTMWCCSRTCVKMQALSSWQLFNSDVENLQKI